MDFFQIVVVSSQQEGVDGGCAGGLAAASMILGLLMMFELVLAFVLVNSWLVYNVIGTLTGKLILNALKPGLVALWLWVREYPWQAASQLAR